MANQLHRNRLSLSASGLVYLTLAFAEMDRIVARAAAVTDMGFEWGALNATAIFQSGARSIDAMIDVLGRAHDAIRKEVG